MLAAIGTSQCKVFSISALICGMVSCETSVKRIVLSACTEQNIRRYLNESTSGTSIPSNKYLFAFKVQQRRAECVINTSSLSWKDCSLLRNADFILGGSPWYKASLIFGGTELDRDTWLCSAAHSEKFSPQNRISWKSSLFIFKSIETSKLKDTFSTLELFEWLLHFYFLIIIN